MKKLVIVGAGVIIIAVAYLKLPALLRPRAISADSACVANLESLKSAKQNWQTAAKRRLDCRPTEEELFGPLWTSSMPVCPGGGIYNIGSVSEDPTCTLGGPAHSIRKRL